MEIDILAPTCLKAVNHQIPFLWKTQHWSLSYILFYNDTGLEKQILQHKIVNIFLLIIFSKCFGCSKESSNF